MVLLMWLEAYRDGLQRLILAFQYTSRSLIMKVLLYKFPGANGSLDDPLGCKFWCMHKQHMLHNVMQSSLT